MTVETTSNHEAEALGAFLDAAPRSKTVKLAFEGRDIFVVLCAPREDLALEMFQKMQNKKVDLTLIKQMDISLDLLVEMAHHPKFDSDGEPEVEGEEGEEVCKPGEKMFADTKLKPQLKKLPLGHPIFQLRMLASEFTAELQTLGNENSSDTDDDTGTSGSPNGSEESTSETSNSGPRTE